MNGLLRIGFLLWLLTGARIPVCAAILYVDVNSTNPIPPYADWPSAAQTIQDAVDAATNGDLVLVTNGVYQTGGRVVYGALTNRVAVTKPVTLQSVNGPATTIISGHQDPYGPGPVRCAYLTNGATLSGFTLTNGSTLTFGDYYYEQSGGGLWCESDRSLITNCVVSACSAWSDTGGAFSGTLKFCILSNNVAGNGSGGGASWSTLTKCTLANNWAWQIGGGAANSVLNDCTLTNNLGWHGGGGASDSTLSSCILSGNICYGGTGGGATDSSLTDCTLTANTAAWGGAVDNSFLKDCTLANNSATSYGGGAYLSTLLNCIVSNNVARSSGGGSYGGTLSFCTVVGNVATNLGPAQGGGAYQGKLNNCILIGNTSGQGGGAYQATLNSCSVISNTAGQGGGAYQATLNNCSVIGNSAGQGGGTASSSLTNCILTANSASFSGGGAYDGIFQDCTISTNLAQRGGGVGGGTLINCTLSGNWAHVADYSSLSEGGAAYGCPPGAWCNFPKCALINCVLIGNQSTSHDGTGSGGGTSGCFLTNCLLSGNYASEGGGARESLLVGCTLIGNTRGWGGGAEYSTLNSCLVVSNSGAYGGGLLSCNVANSALIANSASVGGGAAMSTLNNCTVALNSASYAGGGVAGGTANNCIIYSNNTDDEGPNYVQYGLPTDLLILNYCCTTPMPTTNGIYNITNYPAFVNLFAADFHLQTNSPCINSGLNSYAPGTTDLDGNPRITGGTVDIGAYEFQSPSSLIGYAWLQNFNLPTDGSADFTDPDGDRMNNWQEWRAGTDPTNPLSLLKMLKPSVTNNPSAIVISWQSVTNRTYFLQRATSLSPPATFSTIQTNILGLPGTTSCTDTNALRPGPFFYRVGVQ